jgi:Na+/proline symporter
LFGTRGIDASEHHRGMMLAIAAESLVKLLAFVVVGTYALTRGTHFEALTQPIQAAAREALPRGFFAQSVLAFVAILCLPRQFQVGVVECENAGDVRPARWLFPLYLALICVFALPIAYSGAMAAQGHHVNADAYVLWLPLANGDGLFAVLAYIGGFSAATGMVIVASVALATMISNELVMPLLLRVARCGSSSATTSPASCSAYAASPSSCSRCLRSRTTAPARRARTSPRSACSRSPRSRSSRRRSWSGCTGAARAAPAS